MRLSLEQQDLGTGAACTFLEMSPDEDALSFAAGEDEEGMLRLCRESRILKTAGQQDTRSPGGPFA